MKKNVITGSAVGVTAISVIVLGAGGVKTQIGLSALEQKTSTSTSTASSQKATYATTVRSASVDIIKNALAMKFGEKIFNTSQFRYLSAASLHGKTLIQQPQQ